MTKTHSELHPLSGLFPRMIAAEFDALKADIAANGLNQPVVVHCGQILDGGNRYRACIELDLEPATVEYSGTDPVAFVLSANLHRRHLTPGQQAAIVASAQDWAKAQAVGSNQHAQKAGGPVTLPDHQAPKDQGATLHLDSVADRAAQSGVSDKTQRMADKVAKAAPELAKQVAHGEISLPQAVRQVEKRPDTQNMGIAPAPAIEPEPADDPHADLIAEAERLAAENHLLQERVAVLTAADQVAKLNEWITRYHQLEGRLQQALTTSKEAQDEAKRKGKVLAAIRKFLEIERDSEILPKLKGGAK